MTTLFRWLIRLTTALVVLVTLAVVLAWWLASRSLPDYDETLDVAGLSAPVEIVRDTAAIPHIFAANDADAFFALGFAHAQDRLWQMTMLRRTAQGRLSELFGERTLPIDRLIRRLDLYNLSVASVAAQDPDAQVALAAYASGVNAWIAEVNEGARGRGAPEMWLFPQSIAPWQPADSLAVLKLMSLQLNGHIEAEVQRTRLLGAFAETGLDEARLADLLPDLSGLAVADLPLPQEASRSTRLAARDPLDPVQGPAFAGASNAFAAAVSRSSTGSTLLANDPHLGLTAPSIFYLARLDLASGGVIGATIPGLPLILAGRSDRLGWAVTSSYMDDADLYIEEVNPADASQYRGPDGWESFRTADSIIEVEGRRAETLRLKWSANGPVLGPDDFDVGLIRPPGTDVALAWTALSAADTTFTAGFRIMGAQSVRQALDAAALYVAPSQVLTLADRTEVALVLVGAMPDRHAEQTGEGRVPSLGGVATNRWIGVKPFAENLRVVDPPGGIVGNTNNPLPAGAFPDHISFTWGDDQRVQRWEFLMQARAIHTRDSFMEAQLDTVSSAARTLLPLIGRDLWFQDDAAPEGSPERQRARALALLAEWNGEMNEHLPEPLIASAWIAELQDRLIRDELGPLADLFDHVEPVFLERAFRDTDGASAWCDVIQSVPVETCNEMAKEALDAAILALTERHGSNIESWRWGDAHEAVHEHPVLGTAPILSWLVNIRQSTSGDDFTLMRGRTAGMLADEPWQNVHAAAYRGVYDFADPDSSVFILSTGQSGHPLSYHYDDMASLWRRGEYVQMSLDPALARAGAEGITVLRPEP